jgi:hypothetical protein
MTPEDKKLITVMTRLYAKTKADVVEWEPSEDANIFAVKFSDYTISLVRILATPTDAEWFNLTIANNDGAVIQEMASSTARDNGFTDMSDLSIEQGGTRWISMAHWTTCSRNLTSCHSEKS